MQTSGSFHGAMLLLSVLVLFSGVCCLIMIWFEIATKTLNFKVVTFIDFAKSSFGFDKDWKYCLTTRTIIGFVLFVGGVSNTVIEIFYLLE